MHLLWLFACLSLVTGIIVPNDPRIPYMFPPGYGALQQDNQDSSSSYTQTVGGWGAQAGYGSPHILDQIISRQGLYPRLNQQSIRKVQYAIDYNGVAVGEKPILQLLAQPTPIGLKNQGYLAQMSYTD